MDLYVNFEGVIGEIHEDFQILNDFFIDPVPDRKA
jgi:hypothetical protein